MRASRIHARRSGVILMVVLALLTLFAIVGLTFVFYAQRQQAASASWREARWFSPEEAREAADVVSVDILKALAGLTDFSSSHAAIDGMEKIVRSQRDEVCRAAEIEEDPAQKRLIEAMCRTMTALVAAIERLKWIIVQIELSPQPQRF